MGEVAKKISLTPLSNLVGTKNFFPPDAEYFPFRCKDFCVGRECVMIRNFYYKKIRGDLIATYF